MIFPFWGDDMNVVRSFVGILTLALVFVQALSGAESLSLVRTIDLPRVEGRIDHMAIDMAAQRVFVNVPTANPIAVVDRAAMKIVATWPVSSAKANFPMALDEANHRLFVGCRRPAKVLVYDTTSGKEVASFDIVGDTDDLFYDAV